MSHFKHVKTALAVAMFACSVHAAHADMAAAEEFLSAEIGELSVLDADAQLAEMAWFLEAAKPLAGLEIRVTSSAIATHKYESSVLAPVFTAITGIKVTHDLLTESELVENLTKQMQSGENIYDAYVSSSDWIGTHWRYLQTRSLSDWMSGDGASVTSPTLDMDDFRGIDFSTAPDGKLYQLPDQQSADLYWFRHDWFSDARNKLAFLETYGYGLGVPVNWSAYEDIAEFFTGHVVDGVSSFGHMGFGKMDDASARRLADGWLSLGGVGDMDAPNGLPVDNWGIRVNSNSQPVGACVARGGAANGPAAVYSLSKSIEWLNKYAPPAAASMMFKESQVYAAQGDVAQQAFWSSAFAADMLEAESLVADSQAASSQDADPQEADSQEVGSREAGSQAADSQDADLQAAEAQVAGSQEAGPQEADAQEAGSQAADPQDADSQEADSLDLDSQETDSQEADLQGANSQVVIEDGSPKWRLAPSPYGAYWEEGQKRGYLETGAWTLLKSTPTDRAMAAWLYAQFVVSKTVDLKKAHTGLTFVRESTIQHESFTERAPRLGGLIEFYRSQESRELSPTGSNVPDFPRLAPLWWDNIDDAVVGEKTAQEALDSLCLAQENVFTRLQRAGVQGAMGPSLNDEQGADYWLSQPGSPKAALDSNKPAPITIDYDELVKSWSN